MMKLLRAFRRNERGAVALIFGLALVPMVGFVGVALDYNRASQARVVAASAADAAVLEGVKGPGTFAERRARAEKLLQHNMASVAPGTIFTATFTEITENGVSSGMRVTINGEIPAKLMPVLGQSILRFGVEAEAKTPANENLDVVFVLDTTDSMEGNRIATLKSATTGLLDDFQSRVLRADQLRLAVVPFAQYVNIGLQRRNEPWLDVPADYQTPVVQTCRMVQEMQQTNCRSVRVSATPPTPPQTCMRDGVARTCGGSPGSPAHDTTTCDSVPTGRQVQECSTSGGDWVRWNGCVGSRNFPLNTQDGAYNNRIPGIMGVTCGTPVQDWTTSISQVRGIINGLTTEGETYLPSGLIWGWRMLSTQAPFAGRASTSDAPVKRFMVLVTDGQNTKSPTYPRHDGSDSALANQLTTQICRNMAADTTTSVRLYTVAFEVGDPAVKEMLRECSRLNGGEFFDAVNASQLNSSLQTIGRTMWAMRLTK